jgi:hypothetical protein
MLPGQIDGLRRIPQKEIPAYDLLERGPEDSMRIANRASRQIWVEQVAVERLDVECRYGRERLRAKDRPHVTAQQTFVIAKALGAQPRFRAKLEPPIQELIQSLLRRVQIAARSRSPNILFR